MKKNVFFKYFFCCVIALNYNVSAKTHEESTNIDSLKGVIENQVGIERIKSLYELSFFLSTSDIDQAFHFDSLALHDAKELGDTVWTVLVSIDLSYLYRKKFDYKSAKILLDEAVKLGRAKKLKRELYIAYTELGNYFFELNLYDSALYHHQNSLKIKEELGDKAIMASTLNNMGLIYYRMKNFTTALQYLHKSLELKLNVGDTLSAWTSYNNIGLIYSAIEEFDLAKRNFEDAVNIIRKESDIRLAKVYNGLGLIYVKLNNIEEAKKNLDSAIRISKKFNDKSLEGVSYQYLAELELNNSSYRSSKSFLEKSHKLFSEIKDKLWISENFKLFAKLYEDQGVYDSAYFYHKQYTTIQDSIFNEQLINNFTNLQLLRQAEESQQIIAQKELDINQRTKLSRMLAIVLILSVLLIIIVTRNYVQSNRINKKLSASNVKIEKQKEDLERKNKQLADAQSTIEIQNERLRNVNSELEAAVRSRTKELERSKGKLEKAVKDLDDFIYRTSHDLRGPIATMQGIIKVGTMESRDEETLKYFETLQTISSRANRILNKLIEVHEMYQRSPTLEILNIERCVKSAIELASKSELANGINVTYDIDKNVEWVSDKSLLVTLIENMMVNAFLFSVNKESYVKLKIFKNPTSHLKLRFEDNGYGILESDINRVFDVFFKGSPRRSGTGLEIYSARIAVEKLKGNIELKKPKDNTIYEITLPVI